MLKQDDKYEITVTTLCREHDKSNIKRYRQKTGITADVIMGKNLDGLVFDTYKCTVYNKILK